LLRHAKSGRSSADGSDESRPLNEQGAAAARLMGSYVARHALVPEIVLCSPSLRTRQTLSAMAAQWPSVVRAEYERRLYMAKPKTILSVIHEQPSAITQLMVIGHNPGLHETADLLVASGDVELREKLREKFPTGALAVIDFASDDWSRIHECSGRLDRFVTPRTVAAMTN
jgi:phosphohistidine phosphatase